jgi:hypothetical protein
VELIEEREERQLVVANEGLLPYIPAGLFRTLYSEHPDPITVALEITE